MPEYLHQHLRLHHIHYTEINELYISLSIRAFAFGMVGIFVPIYLYNLGISITSLALSFIAFEMGRVILSPSAATAVNRFGPKHMLILSYFLLFSYVLMLYLLPTNLNLLYPSAFWGGIATALFLMSRHSDTATIMSENKPTSQYTTLLIFLTSAEALSPLVGGIIATAYGIEYVFLGVGAGLIISSYPLLKTLEPHFPQKTHLRILKTAPLNHMVANFAWNAQTNIAIIMWPLFIFLIVKTYQNVGLITSASLILVFLTLRLSGRLGDNGKNSELLKIGSRLRSGVHIARGLSQSFPVALGINVLGDITDNLTAVPYAIRFYEGARRYGVTAYLTDMEIAGGMGKIFPWLVLMIAGVFFDLKIALIFTFVLAALLMPLLRLIEPLPQTDPK